jgi:putative ABC transport system substrate-binding protein
MSPEFPALPSARRIAALANVPDPFSKSFLKQLESAGQATGTSIEPVLIRTPEELDAAFPVMEKSRTDAIIVQPSLPKRFPSLPRFDLRR